MIDQHFVKFKLFGLDAVYLNGRIEISAPDVDTGSKIMIKFSDAILDNKIKSLRINLPDKIIFITRQDSQNVVVRAEEANDQRMLN